MSRRRIAVTPSGRLAAIAEANTSRGTWSSSPGAGLGLVGEVSHSADPATTRAAPVTRRPARRCHVRWWSRKRGTNWKRAHQCEHCGTDDVDDEGGREAGEPFVGRDHVGSAGKLDEPKRAGRERDNGQRHQRGGVVIGLRAARPD